MSQKKGAKGYNPVAAAMAKEKRQESTRRVLFNPFAFPQQKAPWAARKKQGSPGGRA